VPTRFTERIPNGVAVVDVSGYGLAAPLIAALDAAGVQAAAVDVLPSSGPTVLVLPVRLDEHVPSTGMALLRLQARALAPPSERSGPLTVLWAVRHHERLAVATPHNGDLADGPRRGAFNAAPLLAGGAWRAELSLHRGDTTSALRCLSRRIELLLGADSHQQIAGTAADSLRADARKIDSMARHAIVVEVRPSEPAIKRRWAGWDAAVAAVTWPRVAI
jgi:hypothetical protein